MNEVVKRNRPYRSWVEISRGQIAANFNAIRNVVGEGVEVMPVVKADAYRHGAVEVSRTLEREGARWLAVSNTDEGIALREAGIQARILVMADCLPFARDAMLEHDLTPVIHSFEGLREFDILAAARAKRCRYHLKIDTGMGRLGVPSSEVSAIGEAILSAKNIDLEGLMTHFASAANYQSTQTDDQVAAFDTLLAGLKRAGIFPSLVHLSSSIPVAYGRKQVWRGMIRPGHAIYGYVSPARGAPAQVLHVKPALTWRTSVLAVKDVPAGSLVGYGGIFRATRRTRIAVLAAGYADGIPHRLSNRGSVIVNGKLSPILGAVSMDLTSVDVTESPAVQVGDAVTLLGSEGEASIDAQQIAKWAGTISYSVLCGIHARVKRLYV